MPMALGLHESIESKLGKNERRFQRDHKERERGREREWEKEMVAMRSSSSSGKGWIVGWFD